MVKVYTMELAGRTLRVEIGKVGKQANGCAVYRSTAKQQFYQQQQQVRNRETVLISSHAALSMKKSFMR